MKNRLNQPSPKPSTNRRTPAPTRRGTTTPTRHLLPFECSTTPSVKSQKSQIKNDQGYWELTFSNHEAVLPQSPALFYILFLLEAPPAAPLTPHKLEAAVYDRFQDHPDFLQLLPSVWAEGDRTEILKLLARRECALHSIIDCPDASAPVKAEALAALMDVNDQQDQHLDNLAQTSRGTGICILASIVELYCRLALAVDARGNPHPVIRPFARHLLLNLIIPSIKSSRGFAIPCFTYQPQPGITWLT